MGYRFRPTRMIGFMVAKQEEDDVEPTQLGFQKGEESGVSDIADVADESEIGSFSRDGEDVIC